MAMGWIFGIWWGWALSTNLVTVVLGLWPRRRVRPADAAPPISILVPIKGADPAIAANLEALFAQDYPQFEIVFALAETDDRSDTGIGQSQGR